MSIESWWAKLPWAAREWLAANSRSAVPPAILTQIEDAGGPSRHDQWWLLDEDPDGVLTPETAAAWIRSHEDPGSGQY